MIKAIRLDDQETKTAGTDAYATMGRGNQLLTPMGDALLLPFMEAATPEASDAALERLINTARPIIRGIIKSKLQVSLSATDGGSENQDALEVECEIQSSLIAALRQLQAERRHSIASFQSYVASVAFNACHEHLRRKYPRRHSLKNRLRYLISHRIDFSAWQIDGVLCAGLTAWRFQRRARVAEGKLRRLLDDSEGFLHADAAVCDVRSQPLAELVAELFCQAEAPIELNDLVRVVADLLGVKEDKPQAVNEDEDEEQPGLCELLPDERANPALDVERRLQLERLWVEICQLPPRQIAALLLNLKDSRGVGLHLFPVTGVASLRQMALALMMSAEELAAVWNELPLDDTAIARRLCVTRQQVINLRKSARERLERRMKAVW